MHYGETRGKLQEGLIIQYNLIIGDGERELAEDNNSNKSTKKIIWVAYWDVKLCEQRPG